MSRHDSPLCITIHYSLNSVAVRVLYIVSRTGSWIPGPESVARWTRGLVDPWTIWVFFLKRCSGEARGGSIKNVNVREARGGSIKNVMSGRLAEVVFFFLPPAAPDSLFTKSPLFTMIHHCSPMHDFSPLFTIIHHYSP